MVKEEGEGREKVGKGREGGKERGIKTEGGHI